MTSHEVGGLRLAYRISGSGTPPVVMLSSSGDAHEQWEQLCDLLGDTTCFTYGRPGIAGSDALLEAPVTPRPARWAANQLRELLQVCGLEPPYVLVSCSIGGFIADRFAAAWPAEVAGIVQIDPTFIRLIPRLDPGPPTADDANGKGIQFEWDELEDSTPPKPTLAVVISRAFGTVPAEIVERAWRPLTMEEVDHGWRACQVEWARRLGALHIAADTGGHHVQIDQPDLVALVVRSVVAAARDSQPLTLTPDAVTSAGGHVLTPGGP